MKKYILSLLASVVALPVYAVERPMVAVVVSYNNAQYYKKNLDSMFSQNYENFRVIYVDDVSPDGTADLVEQYVKEHDLADRLTLIRNKKNMGGMYNTHLAVHTCEDHEIVLTIDGDDWLAHDEVFSTINDAYEDKNVWLTYGSFMRYPDGKVFEWPSFPPEIIAENAYRSYRWIASHLRTFYAGLFKKIRKEDLMHKGKFIPSAWDLAMMFPMLEMAGGRIRSIQDVLYVYNRETPLNDTKVNDIKWVIGLDHMVRRKKRYNRLDDLPLERE